MSYALARQGPARCAPAVRPNGGSPQTTRNTDMADIEQQPRQDLNGAAAGKKIHEIAKDARMCMFATDVTNFPGDVRPMAIQKVDEDGTFWFLSSSASEKNR